MRSLRQGFAAAVFGVAMAVCGTSNAGLIHSSTQNCGGFSSCNDSAFLAIAAGLTLTFNDFSVDRFGGVLPANGAVNGNIYSADFTLSSGASGFGGSNSTQVQHANGNGSASEVGPVGSGFNGLLIIDFANPLAAIGFGTIELNGALETITIYGLSGILGTFSAVGGFFDYEGFVATAGDVITRVVLNGDFYAIQNIQYAAAQVPEPSLLSLLGLGLAGLAFFGRRRLRLS